MRGAPMILRETLQATAIWLTNRVFGRLLRRVLPEGSRLARAWLGYPSLMLDRYLVTGYQNPRINVQSILTRHALARRLFGPGLEGLMDGELRFAVELNEMLRESARKHGIRMGSYLNPWKQGRVLEAARVIEGRERDFEIRWAAELAVGHAPRLRVLELACGSANDYRSWAAYGLGRLLDYTGVDLNPTNVANARRRFPDVDFRVANVLELPFPDRSCDMIVASDIFEHLSLEALDRAFDEATRVAREGLVLGFFNMAEIPEHAERPRREYQWNRLSRRRLEERLRRTFPSVEVVGVASWLRDRFGYEHSYNRGAYTIVAAQEPLLTAVSGQDAEAPPSGWR
jgi:SAM-dependent methyltransferase